MAQLLQQILNILVTSSSYILVAVGLTIIYGILNVAHFAHGSIVMVGGYICYYAVTLLGVSFLPAVLISMVLTAVIGVVIERFAYRPASKGPHVNGFIVALGLLMLIDSIGINIFGPDQRIISNSFMANLDFGSVHITILRVMLIVVSVVLIVALWLFINKTKMGKAIKATAQNRQASAIVGINADVVTAVVFAIGSAMAAVAGSFTGALFAIYPSMSTNTVSKSFAILILGGLGSFPGAIVGGLIISATEIIGSTLLASDYRDVFAFVIMVVVLMFKPQGLFGSNKE